MPLLLNAGAPTPLGLGFVDTQLAMLNAIAVQINPTSTATFFYGMPFKIIGNNGGLPIVDAVTVDTDPIFGFLIGNSYTSESSLKKGMTVNVLRRGVQSEIILKSAAAITAGKAVAWNTAGAGVVKATANTSIIGVALDSASAAGAHIRIMLESPNITNANII